MSHSGARILAGDAAVVEVVVGNYGFRLTFHGFGLRFPVVFGESIAKHHIFAAEECDFARLILLFQRLEVIVQI